MERKTERRLESADNKAGQQEKKLKGNGKNSFNSQRAMENYQQKQVISNKQ